jgi:hypothetical protein
LPLYRELDEATVERIITVIKRLAG